MEINGNTLITKNTVNRSIEMSVILNTGVRYFSIIFFLTIYMNLSYQLSSYL